MIWSVTGTAVPNRTDRSGANYVWVVTPKIVMREWDSAYFS